MMHTLFKKVRNGKKSRTWYGRYKYDWMPSYKEINLDVTDKQVAEQKLREIEKDTEKEKMGLIAPLSIRKASRESIFVHLEVFLKDMKTIGRDSKYIYYLGHYINVVSASCNWKYLQDINAVQFEEWRSNVSLSGRTINKFHGGWSAFINWLIEHNCILLNPLKAVKKIDIRKKLENTRKALNSEQIQNLLSVLPLKLKAACLLAVYTGMRRSEIENLEWRDLFLNGEKPYMKLRASITKNSKDTVLPLRSELVEVLKQLPMLKHKPEKVFSWLPKFSQMRKYWIKAGIPAEIKSGYDFHALRVTFCTLMEASGVPQRIAQEAMRHSDPNLTAKIYTDTSLFNLREAVNKLPSFQAEEKGALIGAHFIVKNGHYLSNAVKNKSNEKLVQGIDSELNSHELSCVVNKKKMVRPEGLEPSTQ